MYTYTPDLGAVIRDSDGKIVAPCDSELDPDFIAYNAWANAGNQPTLPDTTP